MGQIHVKIWFNTDKDGAWFEWAGVDEENYDGPVELPICFFGPFETMDAAVDWMSNDYPDDDTDVYEMIADEYNVEGLYVNHPDLVKSEVPDEDIREEVPDDSPVPV